MDFAERLLKAGYRTRYRTRSVPFILRADEGKGKPSADAGGEDAGEADEGKEEASEGQEKDDGLNLRGLATPFDSPTRIRDWFDGEFDEVFRLGAFKRTIGIGGQVMLFEHGDHPMFGSLPIASIRSLTEVKKGLDVRARMYDNWLTEPLQDAIRDQTGGITGMSIQFRPVSERVTEREDDVPLVEVLEADLRELGPVLFPAYSETSIEMRNKIVDAVRRSFDLALQSCDGRPGGGVANEPTRTGPGSTHSVKRNANRLRLLELNQ